MIGVDEHLFRHEAGRMVSALTRIFGVHNLALAEDVVQDAFCRALGSVGHARRAGQSGGLAYDHGAQSRTRHSPPTAHREHVCARTGAPARQRMDPCSVVDEILAADAIQDSMLRMMFSCCHARLSEAAQVALILNILCGFSVDEIASAAMPRSKNGSRAERRCWPIQSTCSIRPSPPTSPTVSPPCKSAQA